MADAIETGSGGTARDEATLAAELAEGRSGSLRAVVRRIQALDVALSSAEDVGDRQLADLDRSLKIALSRIGELEAKAHDRAGPEVLDYDGNGHRFPSFVRYTPAADMRTAGLTPQRVYAVIGRDTRYVRLEGDDGKPVDIAPPFLVAVPGPADPLTFPIPEVRPGRSQPRTGPGTASPSDDFLTPPPIARAIGKAITEHANRRSFETIAKASAEVKAEAEAAATLGARLVNILDRLGRGEPIQAHYALVEAIGDAKRAGVIP